MRYFFSIIFLVLFSNFNLFFKLSKSVNLEEELVQIEHLSIGSSALWLDPWGNRKSVFIQENSGQTLIDYQVRIDVPNEPGMSGNFTDIRFTDDDGVTLLDFWLEGKFGTTATFWVKIPKIGANANKEIFLYFDNIAAPLKSNPENTFIFFDDLNSASGWTDYTNGSLELDSTTYLSQRIKTLKKHGPCDPDGGWKNLGTNISDFKLITREIRPTDTIAGCAWNRYGLESATFNGYGIRRQAETQGSSSFGTERRTGGTGGTANQVTINQPENIWYRTELNRCSDNSNNLSSSIFDDNRALIGSTVKTDLTFNSFDIVAIRGGVEYHVDFLAVANYTCDEPTILLGDNDHMLSILSVCPEPVQSNANVYETIENVAITTSTCGNDADITINIDGTFANDVEYVVGWIDFDQDDVFETMVNFGSCTIAGPATNCSISSSIPIPTGTSTGNYNIRIVLQYNIAPDDPCNPSNFIYGEAETHVVNVVEDDQAPTANALPLLGNYKCYADMPAPNINDITGEVDNCLGMVTVSFISDTPDPGCSGIVTRTYQLADVSGNTSLITQTAAIKDDIAPTANPLPAIGPFACYADILAVDINEVTGEVDNCGAAVTVSFISDSADPGCSGIVTRTYQLEDDCGNTSNVTQSISINDNIRPTADPIPNIGPFACYADIPAADISIVTGESDNCGGIVTVSHISDSPDPGCNWNVTRIYRITDQCNNYEDLIQLIPINDNISPTADVMPTIGPFACYADIPAADINEVTGEVDNCGAAVTVSFISDSADPGCSGVVTRTYQLEDDCGNTSNVTQSISINDNIRPTADPIPNIGPFACYADIPAADISIVTGESDNCGGIVTVSHISDSPDPGCNWNVTRIYRITDQCNNYEDLIQLIPINDNISPIADVMPAIGPFACYADIPAADINEVTGEVDNCGAAVTVSFISDSADPGCSGIVTRTYQLEDDCGNTSNITQSISINDNSRPTADLLPALGPFACYADIPTANINEVTGATDNCNGVVTISFISDSADPGCSGSVTRTYQLEDGCTNTSTITQTITILDDVAPTADPLPALGPFACYADIPAADINEVTGATDNCNGVVTISFISDSADPGCSGSVTRTYQLEDGCSNTSTITQTITILDDVAPTADVMPALGPFACYADIPAADINEVTGATDNCNGVVTVSFVSDSTDPGCSGSVTRTYQLEDGCSNTSTITQTITILDDVAPTADPLPAIGPFACYADIPAADINDVSGATDNCNGVVTVSFISDSTNPGCCGSVTRTYQLEDGCSNTSTITQTITILDDVAPTADPLPAIGPFTCYADISTADINEVTGATDNCNGVVTVSFVSDSTDPGCSGSVTRTYQLEDGCSNTSTITQTITILDDVAPTADPLPALGPFACYTDIPAADINEVTGATDNCNGVVTVSFISDSTDPGCNGSVTRTYQLEDGCSNTSTITQTIAILDDIAPTADAMPALGPFACYADIPTADINEVTGATDNCNGVVTVSFISDSTDPGCSGSVTRTYQLEDGCSNTSTITQTITILDDVAPTANAMPALGPFACYADIPTADINEVTGATDNCNGAVTVSFISDSTDPGCNGSVTRTYQLEDGCTNTSTITQTITILDDIAPTADALPALGPFTCYGDIPTADINEVTGATDNCNGVVTVSFISNSADPGCSGSVTRTYQLEDECSNTSTITQTITVLDDIAPTADPLPALGPFACYTDIPAADINEVTGATDNCNGVVTVSLISDSTDPGCNGSVTRTYQLEDGCSNTSTITQTIEILDDIAPTADAMPALGPFACYADIPTADINEVTGATDNCNGAVTVSFVSDTADPGCSGSVTRTYQLEDGCSNTSTITQTISILDDVAPTADPLPALGPFACYADIPAADINEVTGATDNCNGVVTVSFISDSTDPGCNGSVTRTYQLEDECSNTSTITQTITILDDVAPTADLLPALGPFACYADIPTADINEVTGATDNCNGVVTVTFISDSANPGCSGSVTRTYQLEDGCSNTSTITQTITILDDVAPTADPLTAFGPFGCTSEVPIPDINLVLNEIDNCSGVVDVTFIMDENDIGTGANGDPLTITRSYQIEDACGNTNVIYQSILVEDTTLPDAVCQDISIDVNDGETAIITPSDIDNGSSDNCGIYNMSLDFTNFNCQNEGVNNVILMVTDVNGLSSSCVSYVTINYTTVVGNLTEIICANDTFYIGTTPYTTTGFYQQLLTTAAGCDSIVNLDLDVIDEPIVKAIHLAEICNEDANAVILNDFEALLTIETGTFVWYEDVARTIPIVTVPSVVSVTIGDVYYATFTKASDGCKAFSEVQFSVDPSFCPTPLDLLRFEGTSNNCAVELEWTSGNEQNFSHYEIQRSIDGSNFETIDIEDPEHSSLTIREYFYKDYDIKNENYYYRLKMVDRDGQFEYSKVIIINSNCNEADIIVFDLYPNPVWGQKDVNITMSSGSNNNPMDIRLFDATGRLIRYQRVILKEGVNHIPFEVKYIASGIYYFHFEGLEFSESKPFYKD